MIVDLHVHVYAMKFIIPYVSRHADIPYSHGISDIWHHLLDHCLIVYTKKIQFNSTNNLKFLQHFLQQNKLISSDIIWYNQPMFPDDFRWEKTAWLRFEKGSGPTVSQAAVHQHLENSSILRIL